MRKTSLPAAAVLAAFPLVAFAWTPYAPGVAGPTPYAGPYGYPYAAPFVPSHPVYTEAWPRPPTDPRAEATPMGPESGLDGPSQLSYGAGDRAAPWSRGLSVVPRPLTISRQVTPDSYLIDIGLGDVDPDRVEIQPSRRGLRISYRTDARTSREDSSPDGAGYSRSYSISRGLSSRRLTLPRDADLAGMSREVAEGHILVRIPRRPGTRDGRW